VVHLDPVGRLYIKHQIMIDQVEDPISPGVVKQQEQTGVRSEVSG
jgi:hypothetical protein